MGEKILIAVSGEDTRKLLKILEKVTKETDLEFLERVSIPINLEPKSFEETVNFSRNL